MRWKGKRKVKEEFRGAVTVRMNEEKFKGVVATRMK